MEENTNVVVTTTDVYAELIRNTERLETLTNWLFANARLTWDHKNLALDGTLNILKVLYPHVYEATIEDLIKEKDDGTDND